MSRHVASLDRVLIYNVPAIKRFIPLKLVTYFLLHLRPKDLECLSGGARYINLCLKVQ